MSESYQIAGAAQQYADVLGVDAHASIKEIKEAFARLSKKYHPDTGGEHANVDQFQKVKQAYDYLKDPYDTPDEGSHARTDGQESFYARPDAYVSPFDSRTREGVPTHTLGCGLLRVPEAEKEGCRRCYGIGTEVAEWIRYYSCYTTHGEKSVAGPHKFQRASSNGSCPACGRRQRAYSRAILMLCKGCGGPGEVLRRKKIA